MFFIKISYMLKLICSGDDHPLIIKITYKSNTCRHPFRCKAIRKSYAWMTRKIKQELRIIFQRWNNKHIELLNKFINLPDKFCSKSVRIYIFNCGNKSRSTENIRP